MSLIPSVGARSRALVVIAALFAVASAHAQCPSVIRVPEDAASINAAASSACPNMLTEIVVGSGTWVMNLPQLAGRDIVIRGAGIANTVITQSSPGTLMNPRYGARVEMRDLSIVNAGGPDDLGWDMSFDGCAVRDCSGRFLQEQPTLSADGIWARNSVFERCSAYIYGFLYGRDGMSGCTFTDCTRPIIVWGEGPGISNCTFTRSSAHSIEVREDATISSCTFTDCVGYSIKIRECDIVVTLSACDFVGGNSWAVSDSNDCSGTSLSIQSCSFDGNAGAVEVGRGRTVAVADSDFSDHINGAIVMGGGAAQLAVTDCVFSGNGDAGVGGAIAVSDLRQATLTRCTFHENEANFGGAVWGEYSVLDITDCLFTSNTAKSPFWESGGAIEIVLGTASVTQSTFIGNRAPNGSGGAIAGNNLTYLYFDDLPFQIEECTFIDNEAAFYGGAVYIHWANIPGISILDSDFIGNAAGGAGADVMTYTVNHEIAVSGCTIRGEPSETPFHVVANSPKHRGIRVAGSSMCGRPVSPFGAFIADAGGNCVVESCFDSDANGIPDACQVVSVPGDYETIQQAIDATPKGGFRIVSVAPGVFTGPILLNGKAVLVRGAGAGATILQGTGGARSSVVRFTGGEPATAGIEGMTVRGGPSGTPFPGNPSVLVGGGVFGFNSSASIRDCIVEQNASGFGGGAYFWQCSAQVERTIFRSNSASADGGGLQSYGGSLFMVDSALLDNYANSRGGALHLVEGLPVLTRVAVTNNDSNNLAGGVSWVPQGAAGSRLLLDDCEITGNVADVAEGGIGCVDDGSGATLELRGTRVCTNLPRPNVAGLYIADAASEVCDCIADITLDGLVNGIDLAALLSAWGSDGGLTPRADCNRDGLVDGADLGIVLGGWGTCAP